MARIGFIGLGRMGRPIARHLMAAGHDLIVWNRTPERAAPLIEAGATLARTPAEAAAMSELIFTMVVNAEALEEVLDGKDGVLSTAGAHPAIFDMTTVPPSHSRAMAELARSRGFEFLDAPVGGGPPVAEKGALGMMVGGSETVFEAWRPVLDAFTAKIVYVGANGQGSALKLINNLVLATALQATAEALVFARRCGIDPRKVIDITSTGGAQMRMLETRGPRMIDHDFSPAATLDLIHKDVSAALQLAGEVGAALPAGSTVLEMLRAGRARGHGEEDMAVLVKVIEALSGRDEKGTSPRR